MIFVARQSTDESFDFVIKELEEAVTLLPETHGSRAVDVGKANKHSAKAFLGRVLTYWASDLYNPAGDVARWQKAALVNKEVIDAGHYKLHANFRNIMLDKNNEEEIFSVQFQKPFSRARLGFVGTARFAIQTGCCEPQPGAGICRCI